MINGQQLKAICPNMKPDKANQIAVLLDSICPKYGINIPDIIHEFIANLAEECGQFTRFAENLNYDVDALLKHFGNRISVVQAHQFGRKTGQAANQEMIANIVYGGNWGRVNLGNTQEGDGWMLRGSGPIQTTGRSNIGGFANYYNKNFGTSFTVEQMAEIMRTNLEIGIHSACWIFAISFKLIPAAIADSMKEIVKKINGGYTNLDNRIAFLNRARKAIPLT